MTAHLLEVCAHINNSLREWGAVALTVLVKNAMKQLSSSKLTETDKNGEDANVSVYVQKSYQVQSYVPVPRVWKRRQQDSRGIIFLGACSQVCVSSFLSVRKRLQFLMK